MDSVIAADDVDMLGEGQAALQTFIEALHGVSRTFQADVEGLPVTTDMLMHLRTLAYGLEQVIDKAMVHEPLSFGA